MNALARVRDTWNRFWFEPIDPIRLDAFTALFGMTMLLYFATWAQHAPEWLTASGFHPSAAADGYYSPRLPLLPGALLWPAGIVFFASLLALTFGVARRVTVWPVLAGAVYVLLADPISAFTLNRLYVIGLSVLALAPRAFEKEGEGQRQLAWPTRALQVLLCLHYFLAGICKLTQGDWFGGEDILWMQVQGLYMTDVAAWMVSELPKSAWTGMELTALGFEIVAPLLLIVPRLRPVAFVLGIGMHVLIALTMDKLIYFSLQMMTFYVLFVPELWLHRIAGLWRRADA